MVIITFSYFPVLLIPREENVPMYKKNSKINSKNKKVLVHIFITKFSSK